MGTGIVVFAFGLKGNRSNVRLQKIALQLAQEFEIPVYTQVEIEFPHDVDVEYTPGTLEDPPPTLREARGAVGWAKGRELSELWVVAAKPHMGRCLRDLTKAAEEANVNLSLIAPEEIMESKSDNWFCLGAVETRVKSVPMWKIRECILRLLPWGVYKRIAG